MPLKFQKIGGSSVMTAVIDVIYPVGATLTCTLGDVVYAAPDTSGKHQFRVHKPGVWVIKITGEGKSNTIKVSVVSDKQYETVNIGFFKIFGISRDIKSPSPEWTRTDQAVGMSAKASVGTVAGYSDFDKEMPWKGIVREKVGNDVMVKIPKFYYQRTRSGNIEHIRIADKKTDGFKPHPLFTHNGAEQDFVYVGAYKTSSNNKSVSGVEINSSSKQTREAMRNNAKKKGAGWGLMDTATLSAIQTLFLVEYATNDSQKAIGMGNGNTNYVRCGDCDNVPGLTGSKSGNHSEIVYRGLEGLWGNIGEFIDGVNIFGGAYCVCNDQEKYKDGATSGYAVLSYESVGPNQGFIKEVGFDTSENAHVMLPTVVGGSGTTYYCDRAGLTIENGTVILGYNYDEEATGLFQVDMSRDSSYSNYSRLLYIPS